MISPFADMIADSRLYFVCEADPPGADLAALLRAATGAGADVIQLREKSGDVDAIVAAARTFRRVADESGIPFILNDQPELARECGADGVHVGQGDTEVARARQLAGPGAVVGLSTHEPAQLDAANAASGAQRPDYVSVGPVWTTPTKPGRPAAGLEYVRYAADHSSVPWFAIGGIDAANIGEVLAAGARRAVVVRAIRDATDPAAATRGLRDAIERAGAASD